MSLPRLFFVHVMKTAGSSIVWQMVNVYPIERRYPGPLVGGSTLDVKASMAHLLGTDRDIVATIDFFAPHLPFCATEAIGFDGLTMTMVRHPVDRAVSHLLHVVEILERHLHVPIDPRSVYAIRPIREWLLSNHQVRVFSLATHEAADWDTAMNAAHTIPAWYVGDGMERFDGQPLRMDEARLETAMQMLSSVDLVGVTDDFAAFVDQVADRTDIRLDAGRRVNVRTPADLDEDLVDRIRADNELEMTFYEHACRLSGVVPTS